MCQSLGSLSRPCSILYFKSLDYKKFFFQVLRTEKAKNISQQPKQY